LFAAHSDASVTVNDTGVGTEPSLPHAALVPLTQKPKAPFAPQNVHGLSKIALFLLIELAMHVPHDCSSQLFAGGAGQIDGSVCPFWLFGHTPADVQKPAVPLPHHKHNT